MKFVTESLKNWWRYDRMKFVTGPVNCENTVSDIDQSSND